MLKTTKVDNIIVATFDNVSRFNALIAEPVKDQLSSYFNKPNTKLVLDLEGIEFIDSSGFGVFLTIMKIANNNYGTFKICNIHEEVMELFKLLQLHNVFEIFESREDCVKSFS